VREFVAELRTLELLQPSGSLRPINPAAVKVASYPLSTLVLKRQHGLPTCHARMLQGRSLQPADGRKMDFVTAARSVDLLLKTGPPATG